MSMIWINISWVYLLHYNNYNFTLKTTGLVTLVGSFIVNNYLCQTLHTDFTVWKLWPYLWFFRFLGFQFSYVVTLLLNLLFNGRIAGIWHACFCFFVSLGKCRKWVDMTWHWFCAISSPQTLCVLGVVPLMCTGIQLTHHKLCNNTIIFLTW